MRVLHIITGLATGGAETMLRKLLSGMDGRQFEAHVVSLGQGGRLAEEIRSLGIPVTELGMASGRPSLGAALALCRLARQFRPQIIQGWMYHGNLAAWLAWHAAGRKAALVWNIRQSLEDLAWEKAGTRAVIRFCARRSAGVSRILYNSETSRLQHEAIGYPSARGMTIPNGFETEIFRPDPEAGLRLRAELKLPDEALLIGLVARYHPMKDHRNFLEASALLSARNPLAHFVLAGREVDDNNVELRDQVSRLGLAGKVFLLGERRDVPALMAGFDVVATSSSNSEGFPNVIGEAMSCGVPCVVTDVGDSAHIVGDTGFVVPPADASALAQAWFELLSMAPEKRLALGERARQRVLQLYSLAQTARRYEALYADVAIRN